MRELIFRHIPTGVFALMLLGVLASVFEVSDDSARMTVVQEVWAWKAILLLGAVSLGWLIKERGRAFRFVWWDGAWLLFIGVWFATYSYSLNPAPDQMRFMGLLLIGWFYGRIVMEMLPELRRIVPALLVAMGGAEAVWGLGQLFGFSYSFHGLYNITGSFFNPGPYGCFLAVVFPIAFSALLRYSQAEDRRGKWLFYPALAATSLMAVVLPASDSRTAWIAVALSSVCIVVWQYEVGAYVRRIWNRFPVASWMAALLLIVIVGGVSYGLFHYKEASGSGRLLLWKITVMAGLDHQPLGVGAGGFAAAYADSQASYFASGGGSDTERLVAGSPEYAFNEYAQLLLEQGVGGLLLFLLLIGGGIVYCYRNRAYGVVGSWIAFAVVSFASYPLRLPPFWLVLMVMTAWTASGVGGGVRLRGKWLLVPALLMWVVLIVGMKDQSERPALYRKWVNTRLTKQPERYAELYDALRHDPRYLFDYAKCLTDDEQYAEAIPLFEAAAQLSADPMIYNVMGRCHQEMGNYTKAEECFIHSSRILPERLYPFYLLMKLYGVSGDEEKQLEYARVVMTKEPKVDSQAVKDMKKEAEEVISGLTQ